MMTICHHISILLKPRLRSLKTKGTKDSVEKVTVADLLPVLEHTDFKLDEQGLCNLSKRVTCVSNPDAPASR